MQRVPRRLFILLQNGAIRRDHSLDPLVSNAVVYSELAIGLVGLLAVPGLLLSKPWGTLATVAVSAYAIVFDALSAVVVQASAAGGVVPPLVVLLLVLAFRGRFFPTILARTPISVPQS